jgi:hypothetical protein
MSLFAATHKLRALLMTGLAVAGATVFQNGCTVNLDGQTLTGLLSELSELESSLGWEDDYEYDCGCSSGYGGYNSGWGWM